MDMTQKALREKDAFTTLSGNGFVDVHFHCLLYINYNSIKLFIKPVNPVPLKNYVHREQEHRPEV
jgi:hypothetical protein